MSADLLDFSQTREGRRLRVDLVDKDVETVFSDSVEELRIADPDSILEHEATGCGSGRLSADKIAQLIGNLVSNAVAYGASGRPIVIRSDVGADTVTISVRNEGNPIPDANDRPCSTP